MDYEETNKGLSRDLEESRRRVLEAQQLAEESRREALESRNKSDELQRSADEMRELIEEMKRSAEEMKRSVNSLSLEKGKTSAALAELQRDREVWMREKDEMKAFNIILREEVENNQSSIRRLHQELLDAKEDAIREYKKSEDYADDLADESLGVYMDGFKECQGKVRELLPEFDITHLVCSISEPTIEKQTVDESAFEKNTVEAAGGETSADGGKTLVDVKREAVARASEIEEIETIRLDDSSPDQVEEELVEETTPEVATEEIISEIVPTLSGQDATPTAEENPADNPADGSQEFLRQCARRIFACLTCGHEISRLCEKCTLQLRTPNPRQEDIDKLVAASEEGQRTGRRFVCMAENAGLFFFAFEIGFNQCIKKAKEYFPNLDTEFLTLIDIDGNALMTDIMNADPCTFINAASTFADELFGLTGPSSDEGIRELSEARRAARRPPEDDGETSDGRDRRMWPQKPPKGRRSVRKKY